MKLSLSLDSLLLLITQYTRKLLYIISFDWAALISFSVMKIISAVHFWFPFRFGGIYTDFALLLLRHRNNKTSEAFSGRSVSLAMCFLCLSLASWSFLPLVTLTSLLLSVGNDHGISSFSMFCICITTKALYLNLLMHITCMSLILLQIYFTSLLFMLVGRSHIVK